MATRGTKRKIDATSISSLDAEEPQLKKAKVENASDADQMDVTESELSGTILPPEITLSIFERLSRRDLAISSICCKEWFNYSKDPTLGWFLCHSLRPNQMHTGWGEKVEDIDPNKDYNLVLSLTEVIDNYSYIKSRSQKGYRYSMKIINPQTGQLAVNWQPKFYSKMPLPTSDSADPSLIRWHWSPTQKNELEFEVNIRKLETTIANGVVPDWMELIYDQVRQQKFGPQFEQLDFKKVFIPINDPEKVTVKGFVKKLKLHDYQQKAISWMTLIERESPEEIDYCPLLPWKKARTDLLFDLCETPKACTANDIPQYTMKMRHKGGILADEMGLGKTVEVIGLILSNPCKKLEEFKTEFHSKATLVVCPNHLTKQWVDEITKHTAPKLTTCLITTMAELKGLTYGDLVNADVVVVSTSFIKNPNYFFHNAPNRSTGMGRGANELRLKWVESTFKSIQGRWKDEHAPLLDLFHWHRIILDEGHETLSDELLSAVLWSYSSTYSWYVTGTPFPDDYLFQRVPVHLGLSADLPDPESVMEKYDMGVKQDYMVNNLLWRNIKANITTEYDVPELDTEELVLKLNSVEMAVYEYLKFQNESYYFTIWSTDRDEKDLRKYCAGLKIAASYGKTLTEKKQTYTAECARNLDKTEFQIKNHHKQKKDYESATDAEIAATPAWKQSNRTNFLKNFEENLQKMEQKKIKYTELLEMLEKAKSPAEEQDEKAEQATNNINNTNTVANNNNTDNNDLPSTPPLDQGEDTDKNEISVRAAEPARKSTRSKKEDKNAAKKAPPQKTKAAPKGRAKKEAAAETEQDPNKIKLYKSKLTAEEELPLIMERRGTKLAHLIIYLRKLFTFNKKARTIIFSQFSELLGDIEELLAKCGIASSFVEGSVMKKNKALTSFKTGNSKTKVILLSLEKAASGTNLVEASHVIFMEPMQGSKQEVEAYESQAIGRAHRQGQKNKVTIVRFVTENTIEQELHNKRKGIEKVPEVKTKSGLLVRTNSLSTMLANTAGLKRSGSIANLLENANVV